MLKFRGVSKSYGDRPVIEELDLTILPQQTTVLIGPSGCGKSTLLRLLIGLVDPDAGVVLVDEEPLRHDRIRKARHRMGYVIQEGGLFPHLTARDNVTLLARHLRHDATRITARLDELTELVQLPRATLDRRPRELSGGQRQRVSLMRALMLDPEFLLLDEPLGALDPMIRADLQGDLRSIFRELGKTVVLVTHDLAEAGYFADRIVLLEAGRIAQQGTLDELEKRPANAFVTRFVRSQERRS